jgi:protein-L-isoaspartate O-methyltransferase
MNYTATYSPEDNKLRLYATSRLPADLYQRVKAAGFKWAPKQGLFVAPMWTPERAALLVELCGEIGDEDTSLVERAGQRADRFEEYRDKRAEDAEAAHAAVEQITDGIPLGQPILIGHHSEKRARKDAEKIENGMRKAVKMWETSQYWLDRAASAMRHAKYKQLPAVRHRRIKSLEADLRRYRAAFTPNPTVRPIMQTASGDIEPSEHVWCGQGRGGYWVKRSNLAAIEAHYAPWIEHTVNRLAYERAMLQEQGGVASDHHDIRPGGQVLVKDWPHDVWLTVIRVNHSGGQVVSVTTNARCVPVKGIESVKDYRPPTEETAAKVKAATTLPPLCNYPGDGFAHITQAQWDATYKDHKRTSQRKATETTGTHRVRVVDNFRLRSFGHAIGEQWGATPIYIADAKRKDPPRPTGVAAAASVKELPREPVIRDRPQRQVPTRTKFDDLADALREGIRVVTAPQLFPTPPDLARRVVELADIRPGMTVLEPSAGTGALLDAIGTHDGVTAVEVNHTLAEVLRTRYPLCDVRCADFLAIGDEMGQFDRIVMNPPFDHGSDIDHIKHAYRMLNPGGRLVAICANGPRQQEVMSDICSAWIELPAGSFKEQETNVNAAIVVIDT